MDERFRPAEERLASLGAVAGAYACDGEGRELWSVAADDLFPSASVIKVPLVMALYADGAGGRVDLEERVAVGARVDGSGVLRHLREVGPLTLRDLATLAIIVSDNTAANLLIERFGTDRVNERMREWGCSRSRLGRKFYDFEAAKRGHENVLTPRDAATLLLRLVRGECEDRTTSDAVIAILEECQDDRLLRRYLPVGTKVANKTGTLDESRNDAAIIGGPRRLVVAGLTRQVRDVTTAVSWLGVLGWCGYRAAGNEAGPLPPELVRSA